MAWRVVGGQESGIIVRSGQAVSSEPVGRLSFGARVQETFHLNI